MSDMRSRFLGAVQQYPLLVGLVSACFVFTGLLIGITAAGVDSPLVTLLITVIQLYTCGFAAIEATKPRIIKEHEAIQEELKKRESRSLGLLVSFAQNGQKRAMDMHKSANLLAAGKIPREVAAVSMHEIAIHTGEDFEYLERSLRRFMSLPVLGEVDGETTEEQRAARREYLEAIDAERVSYRSEQSKTPIQIQMLLRGLMEQDGYGRAAHAILKSWDGGDGD